jgi:hypothetical protein
MKPSSQFSRAESHLNAEELSKTLEERSAASKTEAQQKAYALTLREMLPFYLNGSIPKNGDILTDAISAIAESIHDMESKKTKKEIEQALAVSASDPELRAEIDSMIEQRFLQVLTDTYTQIREDIDDLQSMTEINEVLKRVEQGGRKQHVPKAQIKKYLETLQERLLAEFNSPRRLWKVLRGELSESDIEHLKAGFQVKLFSDFLQQGIKVHESIPLTTLRDSKRGREALTMLYRNTLQKRLANLLTIAESSVKVEVDFRQLQSEHATLKEQLRREMRAQPNGAIDPAKKREYDRRMGELSRQIKERWSNSEPPELTEVKKIFQEDPSVLKQRVVDFAVLWGDKQPEDVWKQFVELRAERQSAWKKAYQEQWPGRNIPMPPYGNW